MAIELGPWAARRSLETSERLVQTFFLLLLLFFILIVLVRTEGAVRQAVDSDDLLIGVLEDEVLALLQLHADVDDAAQDAPGVLHTQVDLAGKLIGLELLGAQDDVARGVFHMVPGHITSGENGVLDLGTNIS